MNELRLVNLQWRIKQVNLSHRSNLMITLNGQPPADEVSRLIMSKGFQYGYGVFETMRTYSRVVFKLDEHLDRLARSAKIIGLKLSASHEVIKQYVLDAVEKAPSESIRVKVIATETDVIVTATELRFDASVYKGVTCVTASHTRPMPEAKSLYYLDSYLAHQFALENHAYEALLTNNNRHITEGAYSNFFAVRSGRLVTAKNHILQGITRQIILDLATEEKIPVIYRTLMAVELEHMDEAFITQTTSGIIPVTMVDNIKVGSGQPGAITRRLIERYQDLVQPESYH